MKCERLHIFSFISFSIECIEVYSFEIDDFVLVLCIRIESLAPLNSMAKFQSTSRELGFCWGFLPLFLRGNCTMKHHPPPSSPPPPKQHYNFYSEISRYVLTLFLYKKYLKLSSSMSYCLLFFSEWREWHYPIDLIQGKRQQPKGESAASGEILTPFHLNYRKPMPWAQHVTKFHSSLECSLGMKWGRSLALLPLLIIWYFSQCIKAIILVFISFYCKYTGTGSYNMLSTRMQNYQTT